MPLVARTIDSPLGALRLVASGRGLRSVGFDPGRWPVLATGDVAEDVGRGRSPVLDAAADLLAEHLAGRPTAYDLPLDLAGVSEFRRRVLEALREVPHGQLTTYGALARRLRSPSAARAVGGACNANPLPVVIPCHRVVGADGSLGGYAAGLAVKRQLLELERGVAVPPGGTEPAAVRRRSEADAARLF